MPDARNIVAGVTLRARSLAHLASVLQSAQAVAASMAMESSLSPGVHDGGWVINAGSSPDPYDSDGAFMTITLAGGNDD